MSEDRREPTVPPAAFEVLGAEYDGIEPSTMMTRYVRRRSAAAFERHRRDAESRTDPAAIYARQRRLRDRFVDAIGGFPDRTPLRPTVVDRFRWEGCRVETVRFESRPAHHVTATLVLPDAAAHRPPYPGVVVPCGHAGEGKANDSYQRCGLSLARHGLAALVVDPISQGERTQRFEDGSPRSGTPMRGHMLLGVGSVPLGRNVARFEIWDGMRAIDYLVSREAVDGDRIGATGNSGGGTQTAYLAALDDRVVAAAPSCFVTSFEALLEARIAEDAEQNVHGQHEFGLGHAALLTLRAPAPTLVCAATDDFFPIEGTWASVRRAKRCFGRLGYPERLDVVEVDAGHGFHRPLREAAVGWLVRWLRDGRQAVTEPPDLAPIPAETARSTPDGQVLRLPDERSVYDLNEAHADDLSARRERRWAAESDDARLDAVRETAGVRPREELIDPEIDRIDRPRAGGYEIERLVLRPEPDIWLPAVRLVPDDRRGRPVLALHDGGKRAAVVDDPLAAGTEVLAVDLRGTGETEPDADRAKWNGEFGVGAAEVLAAYRLGRSYVGMRTNDVVSSAAWLLDRTAAAGDGIDLRATGDAGIPALHAAALEPDLFESVHLRGCLSSWGALVRAHGTSEPYANLVHGALETYDLPDLAASLGDTLTVEDPREPGT